ncbi:MAG: endolytic transglycosylase MltG [bacterium]|nr:endolytic transglycosylase MltG [bacterium]
MNFHKQLIKIWATFVVVLVATSFLYNLAPTTSGPELRLVNIPPGQGFNYIVRMLVDSDLIRSPLAFQAYAVLTGGARHLKPGAYLLDASWSSPTILERLVKGPAEDIVVTIIEGESVLDINNKLKALGILKAGDSIPRELEGYAFPDTYRFFPNSDVGAILKKLSDNFNKKAWPLLVDLPKNITTKQIVTMASLIEKEVVSRGDRFLVSGILWKRFNIDMPLQVDATVCYSKFRTINGCYPLVRSDFSIDSFYNTYKYYGLPSGPIGNPGLSAIEAAIKPRNSSYWYYLSDPKTGKTIFAETLEEHNENRATYLGL